MGLSFQILHFLLPIPMYYSPQMFFFFLTFSWCLTSSYQERYQPILYFLFPFSFAINVLLRAKLHIDFRKWEERRSCFTFFFHNLWGLPWAYTRETDAALTENSACICALLRSLTKAFWTLTDLPQPCSSKATRHFSWIRWLAWEPDKNVSRLWNHDLNIWLSD